MGVIPVAQPKRPMDRMKTRNALVDFFIMRLMCEPPAAGYLAQCPAMNPITNMKARIITVLMNSESSIPYHFVADDALPNFKFTFVQSVLLIFPFQPLK